SQSKPGDLEPRRGRLQDEAGRDCRGAAAGAAMDAEVSKTRGGRTAALTRARLADARRVASATTDRPGSPGLLGRGRRPGSGRNGDSGKPGKEGFDVGHAERKRK